MAAVAVAWMVFSVVILAFPAAPRPDAQEMNYMVIVWGGWLALCLAYYAFPRFGGACWFEGPRVTLIATDRFRLAIREFEWEPAHADVAVEVLVPAKALSEVSRSSGHGGRSMAAL